MEIVFFVASASEATGVASSDDLPGEPAAEPIAAIGPRALRDLAAALDVEGSGASPLRDATCRSFPVWRIDPALCRRLAGLDDDEVDAYADRWVPDERLDLHERASCLTDLRDALRERADGERLFALLEERAF